MHQKWADSGYVLKMVQIYLRLHWFTSCHQPRGLKLKLGAVSKGEVSKDRMHNIYIVLCNTNTTIPLQLLMYFITKWKPAGFQHQAQTLLQPYWFSLNLDVCGRSSMWAWLRTPQNILAWETWCFCHCLQSSWTPVSPSHGDDTSPAKQAEIYRVSPCSASILCCCFCPEKTYVSSKCHESLCTQSS